MNEQKFLHYLLIFFATFVPLGFLATYAIAVENNDVEAVFPYISNTGTKAPESCIFGQIMDIGALTFLLMVCIRHHHVKVVIESNMEFLTNKKNINLNRAAFIFGIIGVIGSITVGNFQVTKETAVHILGASMTFIGMHVYCWLQLVISHRLSDSLYSNGIIFKVRILICIIGTINMFILGIFSWIASAKYTGKDRSYWLKEDGGYTEHVISTANEWSLCLTALLFLLTLIPDYKQAAIQRPHIHDTRIGTYEGRAVLADQ